MHRNRRKARQSIQNRQADPGSSNVWTTLQRTALAGWGSTARMALLLMIKQWPAEIVILLIVRH